ncbi:MAG: FhaA domain-containing protein [Hyphomicrobiales bacterium]
MNEDRAPRFERLLEQTARLLSGGGLHPVEVLQRAQAAAQQAGRDGQAPNRLRLTFHPDDYERYRPAFPDLRYELEVMLDRLERREGWSRTGDRIIEFEASGSVPAGMPAIAASFADTAHRPATSHAGATQVIRRQRNAGLRLADGTLVPLTHTPFRIGRGPGNDFVYPSLALSRSHAEIASVPGGLEIRDLGSRNGVLIDGYRVERALLEPGRTVTLGDLEFTLEYRA